LSLDLCLVRSSSFYFSWYSCFCLQPYSSFTLAYKRDFSLITLSKSESLFLRDWTWLVREVVCSSEVA
jgi:hypothetical protein